MEEVVKVNPRKSFPTLVVDDDQVIGLQRRQVSRSRSFNNR